MSLLTDLQNAGLTVRPEPGWETRTQTAGGFVDRPSTTCIVNHWDAIRGTPANSYYTTTNKYGGLIYHIIIRRDGSVDLLGQRIAWNAGANARSAHDILRTGQTPPARPAGDDNMSGNPFTFSVCLNYHPDFEPVTDAAYQSLVAVNAVLVKHLGLSPKQVVDHAALTRRKSDLSRGNRFPGSIVDMGQLRERVTEALAPPAIPEPPPIRRKKRMYPLIDRADLIATITIAEVEGMIDAGKIGLIGNDAQRTKDYYRNDVFTDPRDPSRTDWDNLIVAYTKAHWAK